MPEVLYVPVLKGRQGELAALAAIQPITRQSILPLLEIVPGSVEESERAGQLRTVISRTAKRLETWAGSRLLLDAGFLPPEVAPGDEFGTLGNSVMAAIDKGVDATPVVHLDDDPQVYHDAATLHAELRRGVALRLGTEDLDEDSEDIEEALAELLDTLRAERQDVDLVLDLGAVNGDLSVRAGRASWQTRCEGCRLSTNGATSSLRGEHSRPTYLHLSPGSSAKRPVRRDALRLPPAAKAASADSNIRGLRRYTSSS